MESKKLFNYENVEIFKNRLRGNLNFPFVSINHSILGGKENISIIIRLSLDKKEDWSFDIFHNSRYAILHLSNIGKLELFSKGHDIPKFRKCTVKDINKLIEKLNKIKEN